MTISPCFGCGSQCFGGPHSWVEGSLGGKALPYPSWDGGGRGLTHGAVWSEGRPDLPHASVNSIPWCPARCFDGRVLRRLVEENTRFPSISSCPTGRMNFISCFLFFFNSFYLFCSPPSLAGVLDPLRSMQIWSWPSFIYFHYVTAETQYICFVRILRDTEK